MRFYLGTHKPNWLKLTDVPLFVSRRRLAEVKKLPRALGPWALDSGAFSEIDQHGKWTLSPADYIAEVRRYSAEIGNMQWAAIQDWMCEPQMLAKTGKTIEEHQRLTTHSYLALKWAAPEIPWCPVLQGFEHDDYLRHADEYNRVLPYPIEGCKIVGLGSVCRRQGTKEADSIIWDLHARGFKLHAFGFKITGLEQSAHLLESADSMAWSRAARFDPPLPGCTHKTCSNCIKYAMKWRKNVLDAIRVPKQLRFCA